MFYFEFVRKNRNFNVIRKVKFLSYVYIGTQFVGEFTNKLLNVANERRVN